MKNVMSKDAFIAPLIKDLVIDTYNPKLKKRFLEMYRPQLEDLWNSFLLDMAIEKVAEDYPLLRTKLDDTPLSNRAKRILKAADVETAADIARYSLSDFKMFRGMGSLSLKEIEAYMKEVIEKSKPLI